MPKISIITAVHNGLAFNKIFLEFLKRYTTNPYELIIIDNASTDGSRELFKSNGALVIENQLNYSYPYTQNQGIRASTGEYLFFLNNDIIVSPRWDERLIETAARHSLDIISAKGIENMGDKQKDRIFDHKWKRIKNPLMLFGFSERNLRLMFKIMYGNWEKFCQGQYRLFEDKVVEGIVGNNVMMTRKALDKLGFWDERIQAADWDLFIRAKKRNAEHGDIQPCHVALGVFIHHFIRMTAKYAVKPKPFADSDQLVLLTNKWTPEEFEQYAIKPNS